MGLIVFGGVLVWVVVVVWVGVVGVNLGSELILFLNVGLDGR